MFILLALFWRANFSRAVLLWSDLGATQIHEAGLGNDILSGILRRDESSSDTLYFKFHVDPRSDANTEFYSAAFQLFEGNQHGLALGNALNAWAYSAFATRQTGPSNRVAEYIDLNSSNPEPSGIGTFHTYELVHSAIERTIVFKVQYVPDGDDLVTVWLNPDLRPGATESNQAQNLTTQFRANASFDQIHLRHSGGGDGWIFSEMAIATSFSDLVSANASGEETPFIFRSWQREQGLPENYVRALAQTRDGYIWMGTDEGVSRFDGVNFFSMGPQEGFQGGPVQVLYGDRRGAIWIGSVGGGLSCWEKGRLAKFNLRDGLPSLSISALTEDAEANLWIGTQAGLVTLRNGKIIHVNGAEIFSGKPVTALFQDRFGTMWVGVTGVGVFSYAKGKFAQLRDNAMDNLLVNPHCLLVDQQSRLWIGAGDDFVLCHDRDQWRRFGMPHHLATHYISSLVEAQDGTVWAGSMGEGLFEFKLGKLVAVNASSGLSDNLVEALLVDHEEKLWVGTHGGLNRICSKKLTVLSHNEGLDYGAVQGLAEMGPDLIWAAQPNGVYQREGRIFRRLSFNGLSPQEPGVGALLAAKDGSGWVAGARGLLHFKNPRLAETDHVEPVLTNASITALADDLQNGLWAGERNGRLWHFEKGNWQVLTNFPEGHAITAIIPNASGRLWVGTEGDGLYSDENGKIGHYKRVNGLPSNWIRTLFLDDQGTLWIGTAGDGLSRLHDGRISTFTKREGLLDNIISQILEDANGNLWLGGDRGIVRIKKSELDELAAHLISGVYPQIYGRTDGMLSEECTSGFFPAGLRTKAGLVWFPTLKGIAVLDPGHTVNSPAPAVVLEQVLVDGAPTTGMPAWAGNDFQSKNNAQSLAEPLRLSPGKHTLEFRYTGLSFDAPERVRFRYRLKGLDAGWVEAGTRRAAFYNFVPPGIYTFEVIACNGDGIWNEQTNDLALTVLPHFWQTPWFVGAIAMAAVLLVSGSARFIFRRRLKGLEQEGMLERERTRIAQDLHDIMGAKLCRISFLSEHARNNPSIPHELEQEIRSISDDSREVLQSLDEIVWAVNPQKDTLEHLVSYIAQFTGEYFRRTGIECALEMPTGLPTQSLSSQSRHHLFLAVHEALTNILKHSGATRAEVAMTCRHPDFEITVSDNGRGFDLTASQPTEVNSAAGFCNGLGNMRQRMEALGGRCVVESRPGHGTKIRFLLSLRWSGTIKVK